MSALRTLPAIAVWLLALAAVLLPPQVAADGLAVLAEAQHRLFALVEDSPRSA